MKNFILAIVLLLVSMTAFSQGIPLSTNFTVNTGLPIDDRMSMPNTAARDAIPALRRWQGMLIYVVDIGKHFTLIGGIDNANWTELSGSGGGIAEFQPTTEYKEKDVVFEVNRIYYANADFTSGASFNPSDWTELSPVDLTLASGQLPVANGTNFVNKTTAESVAGDKTFTGETTFNNRVTMTDMINIDRPEGIVKTDNTGNIEVGKIDLTDEVVGSLPQNNGGNGNLIPTNASFELSPVNTDWTCSAITPSASGPAAVDGAQGITFTASSASQGCTRYVTMPEGNVGKLLEYSMYVKSTGGDVEVCSINDSVVSNCKTYTVGQSTDVVKIIVTDRPKNANTNANGILFRTKTATATTFFGDLAYIGLPKSDEAIVAKFDNVSSVSTYIPTVTGCAVDSVDFSYQRFQNYLKINGRLRCVTPQASLFTLSLPSGLTIDPRFSTKILEGTGSRSLGSSTGNKDHVLLYYSSNTIAFGVRENPSTLDTVNAQNGNALFTANNTFYIQANLPIAEWSSQTNAAIVACKEGPLKCANTFTANITGTTISEINIPGWIKTVTNPSTGVYVVTFADNLFTVAPTCVGRRRLPDSSWSANGDYGSQGLTDSTKTTLLSSSTQFAFNFFISCSKNAPDYNETYEKVMPFPVARYIIKTYLSGTTWYEVFNDGWVRQGGRTATAGAGTAISMSLPVTMKDTNYTPVCSNSGGPGAPLNGGYDGCPNRTTTTVGGVGYNTYKDVIVEGYGDAAAVRALGANPGY